MWIETARSKLFEARLSIHQGFPLPPAASIAIDAMIAANRIQPRAQIRITVEPRQGTKNPEENLLGQILGFLVFTCEFVRNPKYPPAVPSNAETPITLLSWALANAYGAKA